MTKIDYHDEEDIKDAIKDVLGANLDDYTKYGQLEEILNNAPVDEILYTALLKILRSGIFSSAKYKERLKPDYVKALYKTIIVLHFVHALIAGDSQRLTALAKKYVADAHLYGLKESDITGELLTRALGISVRYKQDELERAQSNPQWGVTPTPQWSRGTEAKGTAAAPAKRDKYQELYIAYINGNINLKEIPDQANLGFNQDVAGRLFSFHTFYSGLISVADLHAQVDAINKRIDKLIEDLIKKEVSNLLWECFVAMVIPGFVTGVLGKLAFNKLAPVIGRVRKLDDAKNIEDGIKDGLKGPARLMWTSLRKYLAGDKKAVLRSMLSTPPVEFSDLIQNMTWIPIQDLRANITIGALTRKDVESIDNRYTNLTNIVTGNSRTLKALFVNEFSKWALQASLINQTVFALDEYFVNDGLFYQSRLTLKVMGDKDLEILEGYFPAKEVIERTVLVTQQIYGGLGATVEYRDESNGVPNWATLKEFLLPTRDEFDEFISASGSNLTGLKLNVVFGSVLDGNFVMLESASHFGESRLTKYWLLTYATPIIGHALLSKYSIGSIPVEKVLNLSLIDKGGPQIEEYTALFEKMTEVRVYRSSR